MLHRRAEKSGVIEDILRARSTRYKYALFLRNLLPAYEQLEKGLNRHRRSPGVRLLAQPALFRAPSLRSDLGVLFGRSWADRLPLLPAGRRYCHQIIEAAAGEGERLVGHAYTRYLGDLNGGQVIKKLLVRTLGVEPGGLTFYDFSGIDDLDQARRAFRSAIDQSGYEVSDTEAIVEEAAVAFQLNISLSKSVKSMPTPS